MVVGTRWTDVLMAIGIQRTEDRPMATGTQYSGDDLDIGAIHPSQ